MPEQAKHLHDEWKTADQVARDVENLLKEKWNAYFEGRGEPPDDILIHDAAVMRQMSSEKLQAFIDYMAKAAQPR